MEMTTWTKLTEIVSLPLLLRMLLTTLMYVDNGAGLGGGASVPDNVVPVPAAPTTTTATLGTFPSIQPPGPQNLLLHRAQAGQVRQDQLQLLQQALVSVQGVPPGFLTVTALPGGDTPQLPLFQQGLGLGLPVGSLGPFNMGALGQALPLAQTPLVPGQAVPAALPPGNFGVPAMGQPSALGGVGVGAGALDMGLSSTSSFEIQFCVKSLCISFSRNSISFNLASCYSSQSLNDLPQGSTKQIKNE